MNICYYFVFLTAIWLGCCEKSMGIDDEMAGSVQMLQEAKLTTDVTLNNSSKIYADLASLLDKRGSVKSRNPDIKSDVVCLAWESNPKADHQEFKIMLQKDTSIYDAFLQISKRRNEFLSQDLNYICISPSRAVPLPVSHPEILRRNDIDLALDILGVSLNRVDLREPDGEAIEEFINAKLKENWARCQKGGSDPLPYSYKMNEGAKSEVRRVNIIGIWTYNDLLDAICGLSDLHWRIDGNTLYLEKVQAMKK